MKSQSFLNIFLIFSKYFYFSFVKMFMKFKKKRDNIILYFVKKLK